MTTDDDVASNSQALIKAVQKGDMEASRSLLPISDLRARSGGSTALGWAAYNGHRELVDLLLPHSDPDLMDDAGFSPLMNAAEQGDRVMASALLQRCDATQKSPNGQTALHWAARRGHADLVDLLLPHVNPDAVDNKGRKASEWAANHGHMDVAMRIEAFSLSKAESLAISHAIEQKTSRPRSKSL